MKGVCFTRRMFILLLVCIIAVIAILFIGVKYAQKVKERRLEALFLGPFEVVEVSDETYFPGCDYDLRAYLGASSSYEGGTSMPFPTRTESRDLDWVDGAARDDLEAMMAKRRNTDAVTGATQILRLWSPSVHREKRPSQSLQISYPPDGAVFPSNLCEPCVEWDDAANDLWQVTVGILGTSRQWSFVTRERRWWFPGKVWGIFQEEAVAQEAWIQVKGVRVDSGGSIQASEKIHFRISRWPADNALIYRLVAPPFNTRKTPDTFTRDIGSFQTRPFLLGRRQYCFNCHTFSSKTGRLGKVGIQSRYLSAGSYDLPTYFGVYDIEQKRGWKLRLPFAIQMTTYMAWAPDGEKLALSANQQLVTLAPIVHETQFAGEPTSDIAIYDLLQNIAYLLPGASDPDLLEMYPCWEQGGESIVYCSASAGVHPAQVRYDLRVVPFSKGKGGFPKDIPGASRNGKSNYFPRYSPDGRWLCFCQSDGGCLIKSSSDLYILPGDLQGQAHRLECNSDYAADSWHSWSSNSRWLVFASKRDDGIYARLYLTQIDEEGRASPAVRLPVKDLPLESFNIPEFVADVPPISERSLFDAIRVEKAALTVQEAQRQ